MRTARDWLKQGEGKGADRAACVRAAEAVTRGGDDWLDVAEAWLELGQRADARRTIEAGLADARGELSVCRRAAGLLASKLDDRAGAIEALARAEERLVVDRPPISRWCWLAETYHRHLAGDPGAARCLAMAATLATSAEDLVALAEGRLALGGDRDAARALLDRALTAALAEGSVRTLWTIAIRWQHEPLSDPARAREILGIATAEARDVGTLISLAMAWRSLFDDDHGVRAALGRAETLAADAAGWIDLADAHIDGGRDTRAEAWDGDGVRRCLAAALAAAPSAEQRGLIARAFRQGLRDRDRADAIAPCGLAATDGVAITAPLDGWPDGDPGSLLAALRAQLTPKAAIEIAKSDWGNGWHRHHQAVLEIVETGLIPHPLRWYPRETLELTRWQRGDATDHVARAFAAAVLVCAHVVPDANPNGELQDSLAPLIESAWHLGLDEVEAFLRWVAQVRGHEPDGAWALLGLILTVARRAPDEPRLPALIERLEGAVAALHPYDADPAWLYGTTNFRQSFDQWRALVAATLAPTPDLPPALVRLAGHLQPAGV